MDFQTLIKQAANIQATKQKELETKKKVTETGKQRAKHQEIEKKREAKKRLGQYEQDTIKSRLMYHGLVSSSGAPLKHVATPSASTSTSKTAPSMKSNNPPRHSQAPGSSKRPKESYKGAKGKSMSPLPSTTSTTKNKSCVKSSSSRVAAKSKTPPPGKLKSSAMPTDFQELLKLAQKNSTVGKTSSSTGSSLTNKRSTKELPKSSGPVSIGVGRSLVDRSSRQDRQKTIVESSSSVKQQNGDSHLIQDKRLLLVNEGMKKKNSIFPSGRNQIIVKNKTPDQKGSQMQSNSQVRERNDPYLRPYPRPYPRPYQTPGSGCGQQSDLQTSEKSKLMLKSNGPPPKVHNGAPMRGRGGSQVRGRGDMLSRGRGGPSVRSRNPNKFYSSSARLISDGPSGSSRVPMMMGYRSTWADEMSEYLRNNEYELEEDDEEEFDDFVVDDDGYEAECGEDNGEDYSSAIRSIFGDRYISAANNHDDEVMESSFAQQQFEEMRSARIGRLEDEEDIKREKELDRKRQHKTTNSSSKKPKQTRLKF